MTPNELSKKAQESNIVPHDGKLKQLAPKN